ncbi:universal stress protein [Streptomyces sp. NPDC057877]|uniref:universal stress protein n=1 Tax=Streptomyces sp. NPDC057877 TaxID=3346269 RepID=UPI00368B0F32
MIRPVVAGVDGSREGFAAADWAAREALRRGLPLRLVHAWEAGLPEGAAEGAAEAGILPELRAPQHHARHVLRSALDRLDERYPQLTITAEQVARPPVPALLQEAEGAELLVIGSQGPTGLGGFLSGSVAMAAVAHSERPIVLVCEGASAEDEHLPDGGGRASVRTPCREVAVAVDVDEPNDDVLAFAFRAAELRRAPLRAVHAWHLPFAHGLTDAAERQARMRGSAERELAQLLLPWREKFPTVPISEVCHEGRPAHVVIRAANGSGLLVVGLRRRRTAVAPQTGPVAHALIHRVKGPVALVPHD